MTTLSVTDASRKAGVSRQTIYDQIERGEIVRTSAGIELTELMRVYPNMVNQSIVSAVAEHENNSAASYEVSGQTDQHQLTTGTQKITPDTVDLAPDALDTVALNTVDAPNTIDARNTVIEKTVQQAGTVELLVRELEWNKELLERTNQLMARQLAEQRSLIADQARRLDEKDRFWARQLEIAQSLLPAPAPRKKFLGLF